MKYILRMLAFTLGLILVVNLGVYLFNFVNPWLGMGVGIGGIVLVLLLLVKFYDIKI